MAGQAEDVTTTQNSSGLTEFAWQSESSAAQIHETTAADPMGGEAWPEESAFYGELCPITEDVEVLALPDALAALGMNREAEPLALLRYYDGRGFFTVDLGQLQPLWITPKGEIICKLQSNPQTSILFLLDDQTPQSISYFVRDDWTIQKEAHTVLLDDREANAAELELCEALLRIHLNSGDAPRCYILDGDERIHHMTFCFSALCGLQYRLRFDEYPGEDNEIAIYSETECAFVWTGRHLLNE